MRRLFIAPIVLVLFAATFVAPRSSEAQPGPLCFDVPKITNCIEGRFRQYWEQNGGKDIFGYPITRAGPEQNRDTGQTYLTQWFERARFEHHPENRPPYDVLLGRLGDDRLRQLGVDWRTPGREVGPKPGCIWFEETGHNVCDVTPGEGFRTYWETHGLQDPALDRFGRSLALFGLPLTEMSSETTPTAGARVLVQWFERGRFEWHVKPEGPELLQGLLGNEVRGGGSPEPPPPAAPTATVPPGP